MTKYIKKTYTKKQSSFSTIFTRNEKKNALQKCINTKRVLLREKTMKQHQKDYNFVLIFAEKYTEKKKKNKTKFNIKKHRIASNQTKGKKKS